MATQSTTSTGVSVPNNTGATVIQGGNLAANSIFTKNLALRTLGFRGKYGSQIVESEATAVDGTDPDGLIAANPDSPGGLAQQYAYNDRNVLAIGLDATINGAPSKMRVPASDFGGVPRYKRNTITGTTRLGARKWLLPALPGTSRHPGLVYDPNAGSGYLYSTTTVGGVSGVDQVVSYNRQFPGELTYRTGAPLPVHARFRNMEVVDTGNV